MTGQGFTAHTVDGRFEFEDAEEMRYAEHGVEFVQTSRDEDFSIETTVHGFVPYYNLLVAEPMDT